MGQSKEITQSHTPGPWIVRCHPSNQDECFVEAKVKNKLPYDLDVCGDDYTWFGGSKQRKANMNLIAAAPELLAACEALILKCDIGKARKDSYEVVSAAVNKAKGLNKELK